MHHEHCGRGITHVLGEAGYDGTRLHHTTHNDMEYILCELFQDLLI